MRHREEHSSKNRIRLIKVLIYLIALGIIVIIAYVNQPEPAPEPKETVGTLDGRFAPAATMDYRGETLKYREGDIHNILLIGVDRDELHATGAGFHGGGQADFLFLISLDHRNRTTNILQIDRDTMAEIQIFGVLGNPAGRRTTQICLAQAFGSDLRANCENTAQAVSDLLHGIPIDYYIALDMQSIPIINDALGGVKVTLEEDFSAIDPEMQKGQTITLQGDQAEIYVRTRTEIGSSNAERMLRQEIFIDGAMDLLLAQMDADLNCLTRLFNSLDEHMITNADEGWLINRAYSGRRYDLNDASTIVGVHKTGEDGFVEFHADASALKALLAELCFE